MDALKELILNKQQMLREANGICAEDIVNLESFISEATEGKYNNYITNQIPLERYSITKTSVNLESTIGLLGKLANELEIAITTKTNDLETSISTVRELKKYFSNIVFFIRKVGMLTEAQLSTLGDFKYVVVDNDNFQDVGNGVSIVKAVLETDLKDVIVSNPTVVLPVLMEKAVIGNDDSKNVRTFNVNCKDIAWSSIKNVLLDFKYTDDTDSELYKSYDVEKSIRLLFNGAETIIPNTNYSMTINDILEVHGNYERLLKHFQEVTTALDKLDRNLFGKEYIKLLNSLQSKRIETNTEALFHLINKYKLVTDLHDKNYTIYVFCDSNVQMFL